MADMATSRQLKLLRDLQNLLQPHPRALSTGSVASRPDFGPVVGLG